MGIEAHNIHDFDRYKKRTEEKFQQRKGTKAEENVKKKHKERNQRKKTQMRCISSVSSLKSINHERVRARSILAVKISCFTKMRQKSCVNALH